MSTHGEEVLDACRIVGDLGAAVADCVLVAGTSARTGGLFRRQSVAAPDEVMPHLVAALPAGPVALVFGPEPSGLLNEEVSRCHHLVHVPADPSYPALNLAQAVAICLYEMRKAWLRVTQPAESREIAPFAMQERMFEQLRSALSRIQFLFGDRADALMHGVRHLIGRAGPSPMEVDLLFGLARQLEWVAERMEGGERPPRSRGL
jgi:tRNA/rRNA methyltransferase